jgi:hypothetical protein
MATRRLTRLILICALLVTLLPLVRTPRVEAAIPCEVGTPDCLIVYHRVLPPRGADRLIYSPIISGDGQRFAWVEISDSVVPRTFQVRRQTFSSGAQPEHLGVFESAGGFPRVDLTSNGDTVVVSDGNQVLISRPDLALDTLVKLTGNQVSDIRLSADGSRLFVLVAENATLADGGAPVPRGLWMISPNETASEPRQLIGLRGVAQVLDTPQSSLQDLRFGNLDVSNDGTRIVLGVTTGGRDHLLAVTVDPVAVIIDNEPPLRLLPSPTGDVTHVAISGDGKTIAYVTRTSNSGDLTILPGGGSPKVLQGHGVVEDFERLQLSADGTRLVAHRGVKYGLVDVSSLKTRPLGAFGIEPAEVARLAAVVLDSVTFSDDARRMLYTSFHDSLFESMSMLEIAPTDLGAAPLIREHKLNPQPDPAGCNQAARFSASVNWEGGLIGAWLLVDQADSTEAVALTDCAGADASRGSGVFITDQLPEGAETYRILVESELDGVRHASMLEIGPLRTATGPAGAYQFEGTLGQDATRLWASHLTFVPAPQPGEISARVTLNEAGLITELALSVEVLGEIETQEPFHCGINRWTWEAVPLAGGAPTGAWLDPSGLQVDPATVDLSTGDVFMGLLLNGTETSYFAGTECDQEATTSAPEVDEGITVAFNLYLVDEKTLALCHTDLRTRDACTAAPLALLAKVEEAPPIASYSPD